MRRATATVTRTNAPVPSDVVLPKRGKLIRHECGGEEVAAVWEDIDRVLPTSLAEVRYTNTRHPLPKRIKTLAYEILKQKVSHRATYNGRMIRQDNDLTSELLRNYGTVRVSRTDYFALLCSNYMAGWMVTDQRQGTVILDGDTLFLRDSALLALEDNQLANVIGVSTLAFTSDLKLVVTWQSAGSHSSSGLAAPAGSGSVDMRDLKPARTDPRFTRFIASAMERELVEESHVMFSEIEWTEVLGYFRWLTKGGKPEYVGVTKLNVSSDALLARDVRLSETPWVQRVSVDCTLNFKPLRENPDSMACLGQLTGQVSMPLRMSLRALGIALARRTPLAKRLRSLANE